ncbi:MAG: efflux RND transporter periplasmic adaptor subunit [Candidatus Competibacteraceae bacterium]|nr:efflux RND transporter periplasmic adaptor subunit [Candidatus Competibacteraceae bacterium]
MRANRLAKLHLGRTAALTTAALGLAMLFGWLVVSQGPMAPIKVTVAKVTQGTLTASTFGIGTIEARRAYALGPTVASRVLRVLVDQGDAVKAGQLLAELDPVDLTDRVTSAELAVQRATSTIRATEAALAEAQSRAQVATTDARRYAQLRTKGFVSQEAVDAKGHEAKAAQAAVDAAAAQVTAARRDRDRARTDVVGMSKLLAQSQLVSPVDGVVSARLVEPGSTVVAGQAVVQVLDPDSLWIRARIDQGQSGRVRVGQPTEIVLRSDPQRSDRGEVQRVDWVSDAVTEERIVNVGFAVQPPTLSVGDLVEVTIHVAERVNARALPAAAVKRVDRQEGVWRVTQGRVAFQPVTVGITTLDGRSQILDGLTDDDEVVVHSEQALQPDARVRVVTAIIGSAP